MYSSYRSSLKYCPFEYNTLFFPIQTFFAANRTNTNAQLSLALAWNRSDIAKNEIFTASNKTNYQVRILSVVLQDKSAVKNCRFWLFFATCCRSGFMYKAFYASSINFSDIVLPPPPFHHSCNLLDFVKIYWFCGVESTDQVSVMVMDIENFIEFTILQTFFTIVDIELIFWRVIAYQIH